MIINPIDFSNAYHETLSSSTVKNISDKKSHKQSIREERQIVASVIKESVNSIIGDQWYMNMEIAVKQRPLGWKIKNSPKPKDLKGRKTIQMSNPPLFI